MWWIYLAQIPVYLLLTFIFFKTSLKKWGWQRWFFIFTAVAVIDVASTFFGVYASDWGWLLESNPVVVFLGPYLGFGVTTVIFKLFIITGAYLVGIRFGKSEPTRYLFFILSSAMFIAILNNTIGGLVALTAST